MVQRDDGTGWVNLGTPVLQPLYQAPSDAANKGPRSYTDTTYNRNKSYNYRVVAQNVVGYTGAGGAFKTLTVQSVSASLRWVPRSPRPLPRPT